jgi:hypothetical protein
MKATFHYGVRAKLVRFINGNDIDFLEFEEKFEDESPIVARNNAFNLYQNYIDVLLESKGKKYISDSQAREELNSFIDPGTKTKITIQETEIEISDSLGNGIGIFMVIDKLKPNTDDKIGDELFIHGMGSIGLSYDPDYVIFHLNLEFDYFKYFEYDTKNKEIEVIYCSRGEWEDGYRDDEPASYNILETPFDWDGYEIPYWWGEPGEEETKILQAPKTVEEIIKGGENNTVEFKPSLLYNFTTGKPGIGIKGIIAKAICAFLNSNGGWLFIGIDDKGSAQGLEYDFQLADGKNPRDFFRLEFDQMLEHFLTFSIKSNVIGNFYQIDGKDIFWVTVTPNKRRPIFLKGKDGKEFYVRGEASSRQITDIEEIVNYCIDRG